MRTHLFTGERTMKKSPWHDEDSRSANNGHTWSEFSPYTNVLWIKFLLSYLIKAAKKAGVLKWEMTQLNDEIRELNRRLNVRTKIENGAFSTAADILEFAAAQGWVNDQQIESYGVDITVLSDYFTD
jgi:serine/threonine-protein kinase haspin